MFYNLVVAKNGKWVGRQTSNLDVYLKRANGLHFSDRSTHFKIRWAQVEVLNPFNKWSGPRLGVFNTFKSNMNTKSS